MIQVALRTEKFQATMKDFSQRLGIALPKVVAVEAKALLAEVIKWTPPFNNGKQEGNARNLGQSAVSRDIYRAIYPLVESDWRQPSIKRAIRERNAEGMLKILQRSNSIKNPRIAPFSVSAHKSVRDTRGRVQRTKGVFTFDAAQHRSHVNKERSRVGMAKGSWAAAFLDVGGKLPAWIKGAAAQSKGAPSVYVNRLSDHVNPSISITSTALGVRGNNPLKTQINFAMGIRSAAMAAKARRMLKDPIKYANLYEQYK